MEGLSQEGRVAAGAACKELPRQDEIALGRAEGRRQLPGSQGGHFHPLRCGRMGTGVGEGTPGSLLTSQGAGMLEVTPPATACRDPQCLRPHSAIPLTLEQTPTGLRERRPALCTPSTSSSF